MVGTGRLPWMDGVEVEEFPAKMKRVFAPTKS